MLAADPDGLVLVEPGEALLTAAVPTVTVTAAGGGPEVEPRCADRAAVRAGALDLGGSAYSVRGPAERCYPTDVVTDAPHPGEAASLLRLPATTARPDTTLLGDATLLTNARLAEGGNAALALDTLGRSATLVWYVPSAADPLLGPAEPQSPLDLLPPGVSVLALGLLLSGVLLALARGRRLGPVVTEPLPVVVRAAETTRGRARLYRRGHDRAHAAAALRADSVRSCAAALNLPHGAAAADVVAAVAARTGRPAVDVSAVLTGAAPYDDPALVRLADDLDTLRKEVRRT